MTLYLVYYTLIVEGPAGWVYTPGWIVVDGLHQCAYAMQMLLQPVM